VGPLRPPASVLPYLLASCVLGSAAERNEHQAPLPSAPISAELWTDPIDLEEQTLSLSPWGADRAPDPADQFVFLKAKTGGSSPGMHVRDARGRRWRVKQGREAQPEVVVSRLLSALGYRQPPVYYLPSFTLADDASVRTVAGGRFRLDDPSLIERGEWPWERNPFVGSKPYQGLLVILVLLNSADLKNSNNSLYEVTAPGDGARLWYVVRDLGTSLGATNRFNPTPNKLEAFERRRFVTGVRRGYVEFGDYDGVHNDLVTGRITPDDVRWATELLARLTDRQWQDAFLAVGYPPAVANRFIGRIAQKIDEGRALDRWSRSRAPFSMEYRASLDSAPLVGLTRRTDPSPPLNQSIGSWTSPG